MIIKKLINEKIQNEKVMKIKEKLEKIEREKSVLLN